MFYIYDGDYYAIIDKFYIFSMFVFGKLTLALLYVRFVSMMIPYLMYVGSRWLGYKHMVSIFFPLYSCV